nr:hypothetical protein CFP56_36288 [Quercus suber]
MGQLTGRLPVDDRGDGACYRTTATSCRPAQRLVDAEHCRSGSNASVTAGHGGDGVHAMPGHDLSILQLEPDDQ